MDIKYRLESIIETEFRIDYDFDYSNLDPEKVQVRVGHEIKPIMDKDKIIIRVRASLIFVDRDIELAANAIMMTYGLSPIKDIIVMNGDGTFSAQSTLILDTFLSATVGALRGVMMKNLKGSPLEHYFMPLIPMETFREKRKR